MSLREAAKFLSGSVLVYAIAAGVPSNEGRPDSCDASGRNGSWLASGAALAADGEHTAGARLAPTYLEGDDGSRQFLTWHDSVLGVDCSFAIAADGTWRCLPAGPDAGRFFADAACTQHLATVPRGCAPPSTLAFLRDASACAWQQPRQVFSLGPRYAGPLVYWVADVGACAAASSSALVAYDLYAVGDEVQPSSFAGAVPQIER